MKDYLGLTKEQAMELAAAQGRTYEWHEATEFEDAWLEVSTMEAGAALEFDGEDTVQEYVYLDWL